MDNQIYRSEKLDLNYRKCKDNQGCNRIIFEDGVNYRQYEIDRLNKINNDKLKLKTIHSLKLIFKGIIK